MHLLHYSDESGCSHNQKGKHLWATEKERKGKREKGKGQREKELSHHITKKGIKAFET